MSSDFLASVGSCRWFYVSLFSGPMSLCFLASFCSKFRPVESVWDSLHSIDKGPIAWMPPPTIRITTLRLKLEAPSKRNTRRENQTLLELKGRRILQINTITKAEKDSESVVQCRGRTEFPFTADMLPNLINEDYLKPSICRTPHIDSHSWQAAGCLGLDHRCPESCA